MPADYTIDGYLCAADATIDQVHPRKDILLVRRIPDEEITASGVVVPDSARNPAMGVRVGEVLKCGPGDEIVSAARYCHTCDVFSCPSGKRIFRDLLTGSDIELECLTECPCGKPAPAPHVEMKCHPDDHILYNRCPDNNVNIGGIDCVLLREEQHVLAIL